MFLVADVSTDSYFLVEKLGSGSARGDGEFAIADPAYTSSGSAEAGLTGTSRGTMIGSGPFLGFPA